MMSENLSCNPKTHVNAWWAWWPWAIIALKRWRSGISWARVKWETLPQQVRGDKSRKILDTNIRSLHGYAHPNSNPHIHANRHIHTNITHMQTLSISMNTHHPTTTAHKTNNSVALTTGKRGWGLNTSVTRVCKALAQLPGQPEQKEQKSFRSYLILCTTFKSSISLPYLLQKDTIYRNKLKYIGIIVHVMS